MELWRPLPDLVQRVVLLSRDLAAVAYLATSLVPPQPPGDLGAWLAQLSERLEAAAPRHATRNVLEQSATQPGAPW